MDVTRECYSRYIVRYRVTMPWLPCYAEYSRQLDSEALNNTENIQESPSHQLYVIVRRWEN